MPPGRGACQPPPSDLEGLALEDAAAEGQGVGVLEVVAEAEAAGKRGDFHAEFFDLTVDIEGSGLAFDVAAEREDDLGRGVGALEPFEQQQKEFYEERAAFYNSIVYNDNAPDPEEYAKYFEQIDPDTAAKIYEKIKRDEGEEAAIKAFATTYSGMKAKQAAKIFDEMVNENQIELVSKILAQMSVENRGDILAQMKEENAAKLTQLLEPNALKNKSTKVTG